jgi:SAM-dependent methyltransferase/uncharacterized protein YbaR (Trm112 family)
MRQVLLDYLACPEDGAPLVARSQTGCTADVVEGVLACTGCRREWPVRRGIAHFVDGGRSDRTTATGAAFAREWTAFSAIQAHHRRQLEDWIAPFRADDFRGRVVLEAGCGMGRHTASVAEFGARDVVAVDVGASVEVAASNNRARPNCHFVQADIAHLPLRPVFDVVFSVGVLHHLERPLEGARALARVLKPGGTAVFWVYGREHNGWIVHVVDPVRLHVTSHLGHRALQALSLGLALPLVAAVRTLYRRPLPSLPYRDYLHYISPLPFRELHSIVYDQLVAPTTHYLTRDQAVTLMTASGLEVQSVRHHNRQSWTVIGTKPGS